MALAAASSACGPGPAEEFGSVGESRTGGAAAGESRATDEVDDRPESMTLRGAWEGVWVEEWKSSDGPPGLLLPPPVRSPGTLSIEQVERGRIFGSWSALDPEGGSGGAALRGGRFTASDGGDGKSLGGARFTSHGVEVISTALLGPPCTLAGEEAFRGGVGRDGGLLIAARRLFACEEEEPEGAGAWTVEARWTFYGHRRPPPGAPPS